MKLRRRPKGPRISEVSLDISSAGYQCPSCGTPVDIVGPRLPDPPRARLEPCGHTVQVDELAEGR